jgi:hypothetical protein
MPHRALYGGGGGSIAVSFGDDPNIYDFPKGLLTNNFLYFRLALRTQSGTGEAIYAEGERQQVHFEDIDIETFATIHRWVSERAVNGYNHDPYHWVWAKESEREVGGLLQVAMAADYLGLDHYEELMGWLNRGLALTILEDRRVVTQGVLDLVATHEAFKDKLFWRTLAKAGVRPALQQHMLALQERKAEDCGHKKGYEEWEAILRHCRKLRARKRNVEYAAAVLEEVTATLTAGSLRGKRTDIGGSGALVYCDPLREVHGNKPYCTGDVDHDFSM